ncbi:MAG: carbohydrate porin [Verrucomicrobiota bacterium]
MASGCGSAAAAEVMPPSATPGEVLLTDSLGRAVLLPTNSIPADLLPENAATLIRQLPLLLPGSRAPSVVRSRHEAALSGDSGLEFLPATPPLLPPYLTSLDEFGNTALKPGAMFPAPPFDRILQNAKFKLSDYGFRFTLAQNFTALGLVDANGDSSAQGFYALDFKGKWAVFSDPGSGAAGWITGQLEAMAGLGSTGATENPKSTLGTISSPNYDWNSRNGVRLPELAWQQALPGGDWVVVAGMVSQRNYFDANAYAHSAHSQFLNSALVHSQVLPLAQYNLGLNLQWQPHKDWYVMAGASSGEAAAGQAPWTALSQGTWSVLGELGYAPEHAFGLGPGVYRIQPFVARSEGPTQGGVALDLQQQLGKEVPWAWFGRFGFGGSEVTAGASAQAGTGFVIQGPLELMGLFPSRKYDSAGLGFIWSQPSAGKKTVYHENEFGMETGYVLQLTPTLKIQPDLQVFWDAAYAPGGGPQWAGQLQLDLLW